MWCHVMSHNSCSALIPPYFPTFPLSYLPFPLSSLTLSSLPLLLSYPRWFEIWPPSVHPHGPSRLEVPPDQRTQQRPSSNAWHCWYRRTGASHWREDLLNYTTHTATHTHNTCITHTHNTHMTTTTHTHTHAHPPTQFPILILTLT